METSNLAEAQFAFNSESNSKQLKLGLQNKRDNILSQKNGKPGNPMEAVFVWFYQIIIKPLEAGNSCI